MADKPRILVADDDDSILHLLGLCLSEFDVTSARNGQEALEHWRQGRDNFDLVILDLMMPKMNGWEVCEELRKGSRVPILILTAKETTDDLFKGGRPDGFVIKPFDPVELVQKIRAMLGGR